MAGVSPSSEPSTSGTRAAIEQASIPAVSALSGLPRVVPFLAVLTLMVAGIAVPRVGWVFIAGVVVFLTWLLYLGWPRLSGVERLMRIAVLALASVATITQALPRG